MDKLNVLMVDDQPDKLLAYEAILAGLGETLLKAATAREALSILLKQDIAVILMDVNMPDLDGFELAALIRQHPRCQRIAIVFVSAVLFSDRDRLRGYESGAVDYVSVPVVPEILRAKISVFLDLYRKSAELERLNRSLEQRVQERTAELQGTVQRLRENEARLRHQSEALSEADRRKNEFLAMLAHELRNPLQPISMALELVRQPQVDPDRMRFARDVIDRQVSQLARLIDDLMDASRITSGKLNVVRERVDLCQIVACAAASIKPLANEKRQKLEVAPFDGRLDVDADATRMTQIVVNLLGNAIKFTPKGGKIDLSVGREGGSVAIRVRDDGIGIEEADLDRIFEMFVQGSRNAGDVHGGLGLGLALVRQIVELHGGSVRATSLGRNRGSEFIVSLPALPESLEAGPSSTPPARGTPAAVSGPRHVLVVDDNRDAADSLAEMLRVLGHRVDTQYCGSDALAAVAVGHPQVIFMDIGMPGLDGYETARAIREAARGGEVFIVAVTGWGGDADRQRSRAAGFDRHLVKPVQPADLLALLESMPA